MRLFPARNLAPEAAAAPAAAPRAVPVQRVQIGELLVARGVVTERQVADALAHQSERGHRKLLGETLVELGLATEEQVMEAVAEAYGLPFVRQPSRIADPKALERLPREFLEDRCVLPLFHVQGTLSIALAEPENIFLIEEIRRRHGGEIRVAAATAREIRDALAAYLPAANVFVIDDLCADIDDADFSVIERQVEEIGNLAEVAGHSPVVKFVNHVIWAGVHEGASDIHLEPGDHRLRIRFRVDGRLHDWGQQAPWQMAPALVSRIKIMSGLDIAERRIPQDGDIHVMLEGRPIDLRVSTMPGKFGEKVVIRILDSRNAIVALERLGMGGPTLASWKTAVNSAHGIVLVTGPTGSGKSTTLYSALAGLDADDANLSTVEDPIEATLPGVNQFQVNEKAGFGFPQALRALLRQDPDIIMVGEIRDEDTAQVATQAALTGHLVLSTLHTNDSCSAVTRLVNIGIEPYLVAATLRGVLAQRLVRKICPHCKESHPVDDGVRAALGAAGEGLLAGVTTLWKGHGCPRCRGTGFSGRLGIFEMLMPGEALLEAVSANAPLLRLQEVARLNGLRTLRDDGLRKAIEGLTTIEEVLLATAA
jgi:type IV pilus assembly protein PilB